MNNLIQTYNSKKESLKKHMGNFKNLSEENQFKEFMFCLLTPQSNAQKCWQAIEQISQLQKIDEELVYNILKTKTRFHKTKTKRILIAPKTWNEIKPFLNNSNIIELRNYLVKTVNGYGLKEASHFLRNIGKSNNQIAILDRHILKNLYKYNLIKEQKIKSPKHYFQIEKSFLNFASTINIPADELDLIWWSNENGELFK